MKIVWERFLQRIDMLKPRERVVIFISLLLVIATMTNAFFIAPLRDQRRALVNQSAAQAAEMTARAMQLQVMKQQERSNPAIALEMDIRRLQQETEAVDREIAALASSSREVSNLPDVLAGILKQNQKVTLVRVAPAGVDTFANAVVNSAASLTAIPVLTATPAVPAAPVIAKDAAAASTIGSIQRKGLDVTLAGNYLDMMEYLR